MCAGGFYTKWKHLSTLNESAFREMYISLLKYILLSYVFVDREQECVCMYPEMVSIKNLAWREDYYCLYNNNIDTYQIISFNWKKLSWHFLLKMIKVGENILDKEYRIFLVLQIEHLVTGNFYSNGVYCDELLFGFPSPMQAIF